MIIPMLCVTIFVILVVWFLLPRVARLMIHTPTAISIFVCLSMVQLMAVFISMRCTLCGHFLQVALTLILVVGYYMYVDGHKAASDVRDEFVSVTEKLMDELAQCYNVLPQLDINNTIDHRPEGDEKWFLENEKTVTQFCRKLAAERPLKDIRDEYNY